MDKDKALDLIEEMELTQHRMIRALGNDEKDIYLENLKKLNEIYDKLKSIT